ncbi:hypothetical protein F5X98DRAFT_335780 [Xylaria grammica]|nr:hypothetical protein F5X98DRAFT_335780 [Xylaria grammica]
MSFGGTYKRSFALGGEKRFRNPMSGDTEYTNTGARASLPDLVYQNRNSPTPPAEQLAYTHEFSKSRIPRVDRPSSNQLEAPEEDKEARSANQAEGTSPSSDAQRQLPEPLTALVDSIIASRLQKERESIVTQVIDRLLPRIEQAAGEAAGRELDKLIEAANGETTREKIQAVLSRVDELQEDDLENLFLRSVVMARALRTILRRVELEEAVAQWEDLAPGR